MNVNNILNSIEKNWLNIILISFLFNASKKIVLDYVFLRGFLIDFFLIKLNINTLLIFLISLFFINRIRFFRKYFFSIFILILILFINVLFSQNIQNSFYYFLYLHVFLFITLITFSFKKLNISYKLISLTNVLYLAIFLIQLLSQKSLFSYFPFGFYYFSDLSSSIDYASFMGSKILIPSTNFPHPNILFAFLSFFNIFHLRSKNYLLFLLNTLVFIFSGSLTSLIFSFILIFYYLYNSKNKIFIKIIGFSVSSIFLSLCLLYFTAYGFKIVSVSARLFQLDVFFFVLNSFPVFGVGLNSFITAVNKYENIKGSIFVLQPIHNVFLLLLSELGIVPFILVILIFLKKLSHFLKPSIFLVFLIFFGMFDHFFVTLNQGFLLALLTIYMHKSIIIDNAP